MAGAAHKQAGNEAFSAKDYETAIKEFSAAIEAEPSNHTYYSNRSMVYATLEKYEEALKDGQKCVELKPDWAKAYSRAGLALFKLGKYREAKETYEKGLKNCPGDQSLQSALDDLMRSMQSQNPMGQMFGPQMWVRLTQDPRTRPLMNDEGFVQKMKALQTNPQLLNMYMQDPQVQKALEVILGLKLSGGDGDDEDGAAPMEQEETSYTRPQPKEPEPEPEPEPELTEEEKAAQEVKKQADAEKEKGNELFKNKQFDDAMQHYSKAVELDPRNATYRSNRAAVYFQKKDYDACLAECKEAIEIGREEMADYKLLGKLWSRVAHCYKAQSKFAEAINALEKSLVEHNDLKMRQQLKRWQEEKQKAEELAYINPELSEKHKELGNLAFKEGKFPKAVEEYTEALRRDPKNYRVYSNRSWAYTKLMAWQNALDDAEKCMKLEPTFAKAYVRKGKVQHFLKQYNKALETYDIGLKIVPEDQRQELMQCKAETIMAVQKANDSGEADPERLKQAMKDPEIQQILRDPMVNQLLQQMQENPAAAQAGMNDPVMRSKIEKLITAGVLKVGGR